MQTPEELGSLTEAIGKVEEGFPPALVREWCKQLKNEGDFVMLWAAAAKAKKGAMGWYYLSMEFSDEAPASKTITETPPANVERLFSPLSHEGRVKNMQALYPDPLTASDLAAKTGFAGGALYHHLRELKYAFYVHDREGKWALTNLGHQMLLTVTCMAGRLVVDRAQDGLIIGTDWETRTSPNP